MPTHAHITQYADIIKEKSILRELINISTKTLIVPIRPIWEMAEKLDKAEQDIFNIAETSTNFDL